MIVTVVLEKEDFAALHDVVLGVTNISYEDDELQSIWDSLPEHITGTALEWGCNDTVFRDNLYEFLEEKLGKSK